MIKLKLKPMLPRLLKRSPVVKPKKGRIRHRTLNPLLGEHFVFDRTQLYKFYAISMPFHPLLMNSCAKGIVGCKIHILSFLLFSLLRFRRSSRLMYMPLQPCRLIIMFPNMMFVDRRFLHWTLHRWFVLEPELKMKKSLFHSPW